MRRFLWLVPLVLLSGDLEAFEMLPGYSCGFSSSPPATLGTCSSTHSLTAANDLLTCGKLEVNAATYFDGSVGNSSAAGFILMSATETTYARISSVLDGGLKISPSNVDNIGNNNVIIAPNVYYTSDFGHSTLSTNPTVFIHSNTDPASSTTQWLSLAHNQTNGVISTGTGNIVLSPSGDVVSAGHLHVGNGVSIYPEIRAQGASSTVPNILPVAEDTNTGINSPAADQLSLIAGGVEMVHIDEAATDYVKTQVAQAYAKDTPTCSDATDTCGYSGEVTISLYTAGTDGTPDTVTVTAGAVGGLTRTFIKRAGTDSIVIDVNAGTDKTLADAEDSVTYIYDDVSAQWWIVSSYGI